MSICDKSRDFIESYGNETVFGHWCQFESVSSTAHYTVGILLVIICILSVAGNLLVVIVFSKYRRLRSPANTLIVNLAVSDMLNGFLHPMAAYSAFKETWIFGKAGCEMYAACCGLFGLVSIISLTTIAIERCTVISIKPLYGGNLFSNNKAKMSILLIWIYCLLLMLPPLLGWGAFVPEGFLTSCSFDYLSRGASNRSYFFYLFTLGFFLPVTVIGICYSFIMRTILENEKEMKRNKVKKKRYDYKAAEMIMIAIAMFMLSWTPYSLVACIGQFGNEKLLTPWVSVLPSLFAKMSTIYNPAIYGLSHRHFRATLKRIFKKSPQSSAGGQTYLSRNSSVPQTRNACPCLPNYAAGACSSFALELPICDPENSRVVYVKKTTEDAKCRADSPRNPVDHSRNAFVKSLLFRSENSLHQKYQILLKNDHIMRVPTLIYFHSNHTFKTLSMSQLR
ncbi:rhodopsin, GQ-coupled [Parasteatoda tepidariorum]|uniref:rhodopsin, GQ-coupled n=1 Tax=Parasteatoda tepidariorum TaxID=114398 RepID=UPI001C71FEEC|nr:rhodopsin, GQ-coupled [Parasteatoda tepidariorum]